jgi:simple sugar transport system permease protein
VTHELTATVLLASVVAGAAPIVLAALGETLTEKAGIINLSLDGTILLGAMTAFAVAFETGSLWAGFTAAALVGGLVGALVALGSVYLNLSQVAVGFVLTLTTRDLAYFQGNPYTRLQGPQVLPLHLPVLKDLPFLGPVVFSHNLPVYFSLLAIVFIWWYLDHTRLGLNLRAVGENPRAAYARGLDPGRHQLVYTICGAMLVGLAGATFSLSVKLGWGRPQGAEGTGWIALALVIFGGWHPLRVAVGAYLFAFLQVMGIVFQNWLPSLPSQVFQVAPFPLMIFTLVLINLVHSERLSDWAQDRVWARTLIGILAGRAPTALGRPFQAE